MNEIPRAEAWLTEKLTTPAIADVNAVSEHPLPQGTSATYPAITFALMAPDDLVVVGEDRVWAELVYLVTGIAKGQSTAALKAIADEIDARLHGSDGLVDDAYVISSTRDSPFKDTENRDGVSYRRLGGLYRLLIQPAVT